MGMIKGLAAITGKLDAEDAKFKNRSDGPKTKWFNIKDKQSVKVAFLQELDEGAENFSSKNGLGVVAVEHSNPDNYVIKALCSLDEDGNGDCVGCERHQQDYKAGWKPKMKLYINVLVDDGTNEPFVALLSQGVSGKAITPGLLEVADEFGTITDKWFKIKRTGAGFNDTSYNLLPVKEHGLDVESYELFDISNVLRDIPYAEQDAFYDRGSNKSEDSSDAAAPAEAKTDADVW